MSFKNALMFYWLCSMYIERRVPHIWSFLKSSHGNQGGHDGAGACMKRALVKEQLKISTAELLDARRIFDRCSLALSQWGSQCEWKCLSIYDTESAPAHHQ